MPLVSDLKQKANIRGNQKAFILDPFVISILIFALFIGVPVVMNIGNYVTPQVIANSQLNASQTATIQSTSNGFFNTSPDIFLIFMYFMLIIATFIAAGYEGANPAVTLFVGLFFVILAEVVSFGLSDAAHNYINSPQNIVAATHLTLSTYLMENLPIFNGVLLLCYIVFVITKKEVIVAEMGGMGGGGGPRMVST